MDESLKDKIALVTGSSRGIGRAIAYRLAEAGANVIVHYRSNRAGAEETLEGVRQRGADGIALGADVRDPKQIKGLFRSIDEACGRLDILVNNAALGALKPAMKLTGGKWDMTMQICARALLLCGQEAVPLMKPSGGRIISISSLGSRRYIRGYTAIGAAKAALESVTRYLAVELAADGIIVNGVCGGLIETSTLDFFPDREVMISDSLARTPLKRLGQPEDIANVTAFLCRPDTSWICGQTIVADGGFSLC